ncbi:hypothetical protein PLEOSDRAFT_1039301, partial [Pleurotus ostreatus PC15]
ENGVPNFKEGLLQMWKSDCATTVASQDMNPPPARPLALFPESSAILAEAKTCGRFGHFARNCTGGPAGVAGSAFASRAPPPGRALNTSTLPPVKCYRCGGPNHMARDCLAAPGTTVNDSIAGVSSNVNKTKTCYKCQQEGHIARECPENGDFSG